MRGVRGRSTHSAAQVVSSEYSNDPDSNLGVSPSWNQSQVRGPLSVVGVTTAGGMPYD